MARRIALIACALTLSAWPAPGTAGVPSAAGIGYVLQGRWEQGVAVLDSVRQERAAAYFRGLALLELGRSNEGLASLRSLSEEGGSFSGPALELAVSRLFEAGDFGSVVNWSESSRADRFQDADALRYRIGESYFRLGRSVDGRAALEGVAAGAMQPYARNSLGLIHFEAGRYREALEALGSGVEAAESLPDALVGGALADRIRLTRGRMMYQLAVGTKELSREDRRRILSGSRVQFSKIQPESLAYAEALRGIGWCGLESGEAAEALAAFSSAAVLDPGRRDEDLWAQGRVYQGVGYPDEAARLYGEARAAALQEVAELEAGERETVAYSNASRRWASLARSATAVRSRAEALDADVEVVALGLKARGARLEAATGRADVSDGRARLLGDELRSLSADLVRYMDRIPAAGLFRRAEQPRLAEAVSRQNRIEVETARLQATLNALGSSALWAEGRVEATRRGQALWDRLQRARVSLSAAQLEFLEGLKRRASSRERELADDIERLRIQVSALEEPANRARESIGVSGGRLSRLRAELASLDERKRGALRGLDEIEEAAKRGTEATLRDAAARRAAQLRLRADSYSLDETEALHLWQERKGVRPKEARQ